MLRTAPVAGFLLTLALFLCVARELPFHSADHGQYTQMAVDGASDVVCPFAYRILHTELAGLLIRTFDVKPDTAFITVALLACWGLVSCTVWLQRRCGLSLVVSGLIVFSWFGATLLRDAALPDILNAGLVALYLVLLVRRSWWALPVLVLGVLSRETTLLLALLTGLLAWRQGRRRYGLATMAVAGVSFVAVCLAASGSNAHGLDRVTYLAGKSALNFLRNAFGCEVWINTLDYCSPAWIRSLPDWLQLGDVRSVGFCGFNPIRPLTLLVSFLGNFGLLPLLLWYRRGDLRRKVWELPFYLQVALGYGLLMYVLAPVEGTQIFRLVGYAWPAFWIAVPALIPLVPASGSDRIRLVGLHLVAAWISPLLRSCCPVSVGWLLVAVGLLLASYVLAAPVCRRLAESGGFALDKNPTSR